jgi:hypothetical protein
MTRALRGLLQPHGWTFREPMEADALAQILAPRGVPTSLVDLLVEAQGAVSRDETTWFLNLADYAGASTSAFEWDAWERLSMSAADGDEAWSDAIRAFWAKHVPFLLSVRGNYSYLAVSLAGETAGSVVQGSEPEFEDVTVVASSIEAFRSQLEDVLAGRARSGLLALLLLESREAGGEA